MFCRHCGYNIGDYAKFCPACGRPQHTQTQEASGANQTETIKTYFDNVETKPNDGGPMNIIWGFLSLIPIVGFILYFTWREKYPKRAKICLWCAIIGMIANIVLYPYINEELGIKLIVILTKP